MSSSVSMVILSESLLRQTPEILAWLFGIVLAVLMVRRAGGRAEKLLLAGCSLLFAVGVISLLISGLTPWIREQEISAQEFGIIRSLVALPSLAGLICLVIAFWVRFRTGRVSA